MKESEAVLSNTFDRDTIGARFVERNVAKGKPVKIPARTEEPAATQVKGATMGGVSFKAIFFG